MLLELQEVCKSFGEETILDKVCLSLKQDDRIGLLGVNGAGKSTLLKLITGELECDSGVISRAQGLEIGYLRQNDALQSHHTIAQEMDSVFEDIHTMERQLTQLHTKLAALDADSEAHHTLLSEYDALTAAFEAKDGYQTQVKINTVLNGMGFADYDKGQIIENLSGGEKTRLGIAKLLLKNPALLILDEPTNHLDFQTLEWLEGYLHSYKGAILIVSHDRYFLDNVAKDICELERCVLTRYKGGYSQFMRQKSERLDFQQKQYERQQQKIAKLEDYIARNIVRATTANMAKSRVHMLEHMERIEKPAGDLKQAALHFYADTEPYKDVLDMQDLSLSIGEGEARRTLCSHLSLHILKGEKVALIGRNGVGKSTLLRALQGLCGYTGRVKWGANVRISYFEQENRQLHPGYTILEEVHHRFPRKTELELRTLLGSLLLSGDDIYKKISELSGGERAKVAFAIIVLERANVLILDEPTNHLDYKTKEVLDAALNEYPGTLLMVSHDRYLLNRVPTRIVEMFEDKLLSYDGGYDAYLSHRQAAPQPTEKAGKAEKKEAPAENPFYRSKAQRSEQARIKNRIAALEKEIEALEAEAAALEQQISSQELASDYQKLSQACADLEEKRALIAQRMDEWVEYTEKQP